MTVILVIPKLDTLVTWHDTSIVVPSPAHYVANKLERVGKAKRENY